MKHVIAFYSLGEYMTQLEINLSIIGRSALSGGCLYIFESCDFYAGNIAPQLWETFKSYMDLTAICC